MRGGRPALASKLALIALYLGCSRSAEPTPAQRAELERYVSTAPPSEMSALDIDFDGKLHLVGYTISPRQALYPPGTPVTVTLVWRADTRLDDGWLLFSHLIGPQGQVLSNLDDRGPLRHLQGFAGQPLPPSRWQPGKFYRDEISFTIPENPPPVVSLTAGVYKGTTRMPIQAWPDGRAVVARLATGAKDMRSIIKEITAQRLAEGESITIDGRLDESAWSHAGDTGPFVDVGSGRENPMLPTQGRARLLWDDRFAYIAFEAKDAKVRGGFPADAKDPHLWERDTVEIMADPDGDGDNKDYYEIQVNPQNLVFDTQYDDYNRPNGGGRGPFGHEEWSAGLSSAVIVHGTLDDDSDVDQGYTVEVKIPWASFTKARTNPPAPGSSWRMNFYVMQNNGGVAWSPILGMGNFHRASRFGRVRWGLPETH